MSGDTVQVPVYVLTGFLGAGKTTLLRQLLPALRERGQRPVVLMNEFGSISVDTLLLQGENTPVVDMVDGCVCCTLNGSLPESVLDTLDRYQPDVLLLETTGVAAPLDIIESLLVPELVQRTRIGGIYTLVNAERFPVEALDSTDPNPLELTMREQVRYADALLITKTDLVTPGRRTQLMEALGRLNEKASRFEVVHGKIDASRLLAVGAMQRERRGPVKPKGFTRRKTGGKVSSTLRERPTSFGDLQTFLYEFAGPVDREQLFQCLAQLPETVLRAKGFFQDASTGLLLEFHATGPGQMSVGMQMFEHGRAFALLIGEDLQTDVWQERLQACEQSK